MDGYSTTLADLQAFRDSFRDQHELLSPGWLADASRRAEAARHERLVSRLAGVFGAAQADPRFVLEVR